MRAGVALFGLCCWTVSATALAGERSPRELYDALNALRVDPASTYQIEVTNRIELRRAELFLSFEAGKLAFFASLDGRTTGAVFSGRGHVLAAPRNAVEKQQMARFLGAPVLDEDFTDVCLRFTDATADELLHQLGNAKVAPQADPDFADRWNSLVAATNTGQSLRILFDSLSREPRPYFYAGIEGIATGPLDAIIDMERAEPVLFGQPKKSGTRTFYDVWASHEIAGVAPRPASFRALQYTIDTSLLADNSLDAKTDIRLRAETSGARLLIFELSRALSVDAITGQHGEALTFFQNEGMSPQERSIHGNDYLYVVLPAASASVRGSEFVLHFHYRGNVIENAGNGVLFVGARESWYPHFGGTADFADYDLTMRWPRRLRLVATGAKSGEREDGDFRVAHWHTEHPISVAGFNVGDYASSSLASGSRSVEVYANRLLERAIDNRLASPPIEPPRPPSFSAEGPSPTRNMMRIAPVPPSPADALKQLGRDVDSSIRFYETYSGPFPFQKLSVSQIPGSFGQGWPGLLYLSTFSFLPAEAQQRAGLSSAGQESFSEIVPFHEVAHQWWGNVVGWDSYRDQWIDEAIANYLALLFADSQKRSDHSLHLWLDRYRRHLVTKYPGVDQTASEIGALELGNRLSSSKSPNGFEDVIYSKGSWVIHMLREMLRQPGVKNPDARFIALLRTLESKYAYRGLSTADFRREIEAIMTPSMDLEGGRSMEWFFEQWVHGIGIPHYRVEYIVHPTDKGYSVKGKLFQGGVPHSFIAPVPLYSAGVGTHATPLGIVIATGEETPFHFTTQTEPHKILIDPQMTLLCVTQ